MKQEKEIIWNDAFACHFAGWVNQSIRAALLNNTGFDMQKILEEYKEAFGTPVKSPEP